MHQLKLLIRLFVIHLIYWSFYHLSDTVTEAASVVGYKLQICGLKSCLSLIGLSTVISFHYFWRLLGPVILASCQKIINIYICLACLADAAHKTVNISCFIFDFSFNSRICHKHKNQKYVANYLSFLFTLLLSKYALSYDYI